MGSCMSTPLPPNVFKVTPINDDKENAQKGVMIVSNTDLTYTNSRTQEQLEWPLRFLRKYGCDGNVFSFEAGRKCPGGEGLYAFSTKRASQLFELVARNINQGNLQPPSDLSPVTMEANWSLISGLGRAPDASQASAVEMPVAVVRPAPLPPLPLGGPIVTVTSEAATNGSIPPPLPESRIPPTKPYQTLQFDKEAELYPPPSPADKSAKYASIDFEGTEQSNRRRNGTAPTSVRPTKGARKRSQTSFSSGTKGPRKASQSSVDSHSSMTESTRDPITSPNSSLILPGTQNYQNIVMGEQGLQVVDGPQSNYQNIVQGAGAGALEQPNYQNISVGQDVTSSLALLSSSPQAGHQSYANFTHQNYANLSLGPASPRPTELLSTPVTHTVSISVGGSTYGSYAELDLTGASMATTPTLPHGPAAAQTVLIMEAGGSGEGGKGNGGEGGAGEGAAASVDRPRDKEEVNYGSLDFNAMKELEKMQKERERLKQEGGEPMSREKDRTSSTQNHKKHK
eukprot:Em0021g269a